MSAAYSIDRGLTLLALAFKRDFLGGFRGRTLAIRSRTNGLWGFLYSTTFSLPRVIEAYGQNVRDRARGLAPNLIDASTQEQLRSLGYVE